MAPQRGMGAAAILALLVCAAFAETQPTPDCDEDQQTAIKNERPRFLKFAEARGMDDAEIDYGPYIKLPLDFEVGKSAEQVAGPCLFGDCGEAERIVASEKTVVDESAPVETVVEEGMEDEVVVEAVENPWQEKWEREGFSPDKLEGEAEPAKGKDQLLQATTEAEAGVGVGLPNTLPEPPPGKKWVLEDPNYNDMNPPEYKLVWKDPVKEAKAEEGVDVEAEVEEIHETKSEWKPPKARGVGPNGLKLAARSPGSDVMKKILTQKEREYDDAVNAAIEYAKSMMPKEQFDAVEQPPALDIPMLPEVPWPPEDDGVVTDAPLPQEHLFLTPSPSLSPSPTPSATPTSQLSAPELEWADCDDAPDVPEGTPDGVMAAGQYDIDMLKGQRQPRGEDSSIADIGAPPVIPLAFQRMPMHNQEERINKVNFKTTHPESSDPTMEDVIFQQNDGQTFSLQHEPLYHPRPDTRPRSAMLAGGDMGPYDANLTQLDEINDKASYVAHDIINTQSPLRQFIIKEELKANELSHNVTWALMNDPRARPDIEPPAESPIPSPSPSLTPTASLSLSASPSPSPSASASVTPMPSTIRNITRNASSTASPSPSSSPLPSALVEPEWVDYANRYQLPSELDENDDATKAKALEYELHYMKLSDVAEGEILVKNGTDGSQTINGEVIPMVEAAGNQQPLNNGAQDPRNRAPTALTPDQLSAAMYGASMQSEANSADDSLLNAYLPEKANSVISGVDVQALLKYYHGLDAMNKAWGEDASTIPVSQAAKMQMLQSTLKMQGEEGEVAPHFEAEEPGNMILALAKLQQEIAANLTNSSIPAAKEGKVDTSFLKTDGLDLLDVRGFEDNPNSIPPKNPLPLGWRVPAAYITKFLHPSIPIMRVPSTDHSNSTEIPSTYMPTVPEGAAMDLKDVNANEFAHASAVRAFFAKPEAQPTAFPDLSGLTVQRNDAGGPMDHDFRNVREARCASFLSCDECAKDPACGWCSQHAHCYFKDRAMCGGELISKRDAAMCSLENPGASAATIPQYIDDAALSRKRGPFYSAEEIEEEMVTQTPLQVLGSLNGKNDALIEQTQPEVSLSTAMNQNVGGDAMP